MGLEHWNALNMASQPLSAGEGFDLVSKFLLSSFTTLPQGVLIPNKVDLNGS